MSHRPELDFDPHSPESIEDPYPLYARAREECPVFHSDRYGGFWNVMRYADVKEVIELDEGRRFTSTVPGFGGAFPIAFKRDFPYAPQEYDAPEHAEYRGLISRYFARPHIRKHEPAFQARADELIAALAENPQPDLVQDFAIPFVGRNLMVVLGLPDDDWKVLSGITVDIFHGRMTDPERSLSGGRRLREYIEGVLADRRARARDDFFSIITSGEVFGRPLTEQEQLGYGTLIINAGLETTINGIANSLWYIAQHDEVRQRLLSDPTVLPLAVEEFLRYLTPLQSFARNASTDLEFQGCPIQQGEVVLTNFGSANRDPEVFDEPDTFRIDRAPNRHLTFGTGRHTCLGNHLARLEMILAIQSLLAAFPRFTLDPEREVERHPHGDLRGFWRLPVILDPR